jgi:hypothetical protein
MVPDAPLDEQFDFMTLRYDLFDVNGDVVVETPPSSQVTSVEDLYGAISFDAFEPLFATRLEPMRIAASWAEV